MSSIEYLSPLNASQFVEQWYEMATAEHFWMDWRTRALSALVADLGLRWDQPLKVLDVGSGNGVLRKHLEARGQWVVDCADLNEVGLNQSKSGRGRTLYYNIEDRSAACVGRYDLVLAFDVIEHLGSPSAFLKACADHLVPGGKLLINVPALPWMYSEYDRCVGHHRRYSPTMLRSEVSAVSLELRESRYWGASLVPVLAVRKLLLSCVRRDQKVVRLGFEAPHFLAQAFFRWLGRLETLVLKKPILGSSLMAVVERA